MSVLDASSSFVALIHLWDAPHWFTKSRWQLLIYCQYLHHCSFELLSLLVWTPTENAKVIYQNDTNRFHSQRMSAVWCFKADITSGEVILNSLFVTASNKLRMINTSLLIYWVAHRLCCGLFLRVLLPICTFQAAAPSRFSNLPGIWTPDRMTAFPAKTLHGRSSLRGTYQNRNF